MYYILKTDVVKFETIIVDSHSTKGLCLEALYVILNGLEKDNQIVIDREGDGKVNIYKRNIGFIWSNKELIEYYHIVEYDKPKGSELTKIIKEKIKD